MSIEEAILEKVRVLPPEKQQEVLDFAEFLAQKIEVTNSSIKGSFQDEPFVGIWREREEMSDSSAWVRRTRQQEWQGLE
ncbi:DUF2281 domain-containing protein [Phormidium sp. LEGE 05292]|uniref:DUF2281 domain-containing protein n=1 Tax=[Phormidium] sp. LEGE 05292 TaxID=767427 RepID=UPI0018827892|nr:DUF2281 domain-containing protein [Phormidium sp. LEGE 05292]MBE9229685.1 DUF2281 domain-containing protein [Phormidium sp. LEGE 05292]